MKRHVIITLDHRDASGGVDRQWRSTCVWYITADNEDGVYEQALVLTRAQMRHDEPPLPIEARPVTLFYRAVKA